MLSKCANPSCSTELIYLREGKIFFMDQPAKLKLKAPGPVPAKSANRVEHFWLCGRCAAHLTLVYEPECGIQVVPKTPAIKRAAVS